MNYGKIIAELFEGSTFDFSNSSILYHRDISQRHINEKRKLNDAKLKGWRDWQKEHKFAREKLDHQLRCAEDDVKVYEGVLAAFIERVGQTGVKSIANFSTEYVEKEIRLKIGYSERFRARVEKLVREFKKTDYKQYRDHRISVLEMEVLRLEKLVSELSTEKILKDLLSLFPETAKESTRAMEFCGPQAGASSFLAEVEGFIHRDARKRE